MCLYVYTLVCVCMCVLPSAPVQNHHTQFGRRLLYAILCALLLCRKMRKAGKPSGMYMLKNMLFMLEFIRWKIFFELCLDVSS